MKTPEFPEWLAACAKRGDCHCLDECEEKAKWLAAHVNRSGTVADISDNELLARAVRSLVAYPPVRGGWTVGEAVMHRFALGSTYAAQLCRRFGVDPDKMVRKPR